MLDNFSFPKGKWVLYLLNIHITFNARGDGNVTNSSELPISLNIENNRVS